MRQVCLLSAISLGVAIVMARPCAAETVLALGFPPEGPTNGWVGGWSSDATQALNICKGIDKTNNIIPVNPSASQNNCAIVATLNNQCFAISSNGTSQRSPTGFSWIVATDSNSANSQAIANCQKTTGKDDPPCVIRASECDGSAK